MLRLIVCNDILTGTEQRSGGDDRGGKEGEEGEWDLHRAKIGGE